MKTYCLLFLTVTQLLGGQAGGVADAGAAWRIEKASVTPVKQRDNILTASVLRLSDSRRMELSDHVVLDTIRDAFVRGDRLVLLGDAGRASAVETFDLARQAKVDWFFCLMPRRVADNWIVYNEFYIAQGTRHATDVILVYDLAKTPLENRMEKEPGRRIPPLSSDYPLQVGFPIYPEFNASQRSYQNAVKTDSEAAHCLGGPMTLLPLKKLVFKCWAGPNPDVVGSHEYLVVVDLSRGLEDPPSRTVIFPTMGEYGTNIEKIEAVPPNSVRLVFPAGQYRVDSLVVDLPPS